jgi:hypothetical protein
VRRIVILIISLFSGLFSTAGGPVSIKPEPSWILPSLVDETRTPNAKDISGGYYYDLMDRQINLDKQTVYVNIIRHIVNESGVQEASEVSVSFSPQFQQIVFHKVVIIRKGLPINQLISFSLVAQFLLVVAYNMIKASIDLTSVKSEATTQLIRSLVYAGIWISFIVKSENVKRIFVYPYN